MKASPDPALDWRSFMTEPVLYMDPARFEACFEGVFPPAVCRKMQGSARLRSRLSDVVQTHYQLDPWVDPEQMEAIDRAIALEPAQGLMDLALRAGAIYWSSAIAGAVLAKTVAALHSQLGDDLCAYAIAHRDLTGPAQRLEPLDDVGDRIEDDGWRCLAAWCEAVPAGIGLRVRLKLPTDSIMDQPAPPEFKARGPEIIRRAAA
jgi:hypothetical protein